jgi:hypothetical protein
MAIKLKKRRTPLTKKAAARNTVKNASRQEKKSRYYVVLAEPSSKKDKPSRPYSRSGDIHVEKSPQEAITERNRCCGDLVTGDVVYELVPVGTVRVPDGGDFVPLTPKTKKKR